MKRLFRTSRWFHKYLGLLLIVYGVLMGVTGVVMNHRDWIEPLSMPRWTLPSQYRPLDFNRDTLTDVIYAPANPDLAYLIGSEGVWKTTNGGRSFVPLYDGFPQAASRRPTNDLLLLDEPGDRVLAGTRHGLYLLDKTNTWRHAPLGDEREIVRSLLAIDDRVLAFTESHIYEADRDTLDFSAARAPRAAEPGDEYDRVSLVHYVFDAHSGTLFGLPGKLIFDVAGVIIVFLSVSAFYLWYYPWRRKRRNRLGRGVTPSRIGRAVLRVLFKYHLKIGIWVAPMLLIIAGTGFFMRPPVIVALVGGSVPASLAPGAPEAHEWHHRIHAAIHDAPRGRIIVEAIDGFWAAPDDLSKPFEPIEIDAPIHVMRGTVLELAGEDQLIVGSFNGLFRYDLTTGESIDLLTNAPPRDVTDISLADYLVTGSFTTPDGERLLTGLEAGVVPLGGASLDGRFEMPRAMSHRYRMPLWNYLFELHNGRFFKDWIGAFYLLVPVLGSLLFFVLTATGVFDWVYLKVILPRRKRKQRARRALAV